MNSSQITPEMARAELSRREQARQEISRRQSPIHRIVENPLTQGVLGAGDALSNQIGNVANLIPGVNVDPIKSGDGLSYGIGNAVGNAAGYIGGGELLGSTKLVKSLGQSPLASVAKNILGSTGYGALENPEDRLKGAGEGALFGAVGEAIPAIGKRVLSSFKPQEHAEKFLSYLSGGKSLEDNAKYLAEKIKTHYQSAKDKAKSLYDPVLKDSGLGDKIIYESKNPYGMIYDSKKSYPDLNIINPTGKLKELNDSFEKRPTLSNAHALQSQLGAEANSISKIDYAHSGLKNNYNEAKRVLGKHIDDFLTKTDPKIAKKYEEASIDYKENVVPYLENKSIRDIAQSKITNPRNIGNLFSNPEHNIERIIADLGEEGKNRVLYSALKQTQGKAHPESLVRSLSNLDEKGLSSYLNRDTYDLAKQLERKIRNRDFAQSLGGVLLGSQIGKATGLAAGETIGGVLGGLKTPSLIKSVQPQAPKNSYYKKLADIIGNNYKQSIMANIL